MIIILLHSIGRVALLLFPGGFIVLAGPWFVRRVRARQFAAMKGE